MRVTPVEPGHRIRIPEEWADEMGLTDVAALEKTEAGILVRARPRATWDDVFATKLPMSGTPAVLDLSGVSGDDILF